MGVKFSYKSKFVKKSTKSFWWITSIISLGFFNFLTIILSFMKKKLEFYIIKGLRLVFTSLYDTNFRLLFK